MRKNYPHNVIRLRRGKKVREQIFHIIVILNKKKEKSLKVIYKLGYIQFGKKIIFSIDLYKLAFFLNKGFIIKKNVKRLIALMIQPNNIKKKNGGKLF
jgi:ribosomal protein S16